MLLKEYIMESLDKLYRYNIDLLTYLDVPFSQWQHEPILNFTIDALVASKLGWTGVHSKSLFLKLKGGGYALYLTDKDTRLDDKLMKSLLGERPSICDGDEMTRVLGCLPGAVCPFGVPADIPLIVDNALYHAHEILYTPAKPEFTVGFSGRYLKPILDHIDNRIIELTK